MKNSTADAVLATALPNKLYKNIACYLRCAAIVWSTVIINVADGLTTGNEARREMIR